MVSRRVVSRLLALLLAMVGGGGCALQDGGSADPAAPVPSTFASDRQLEAYLKEQLARSLVPVDLGWGTAVEFAAGDGGSVPGAGAAEPAGYSGTNLQEAGVDESDVVKTDGRTLFVAGDRAVSVVSIGADPTATLALLGRIPVDGRVESLYLRGGLLAVLYTPAAGEGDSWGGVEPALPDVLVGMPYWLPVAAQTGVLLVDVSDPAAPVPLRDWTFDGTLVSSRLLGSRLHLVQQFLPRLPPLEIRYGAEDQREPTAQANLARLEPVALDDLLPRYSVRDGTGAPQGQGRLVATADFLRPPEPCGGSIVAVVTLDLDAPAAPHRAVGAVLDAHHVYASPHTLYLAAQRWIPATEAGVWVGGEVRTAVHGFDLAGETVRYLGSGTVEGAVLNQFSFGEYQGVLRVATTTGWGGDAGNHVFCLRPGGDGLEVAGALRGLAPGESLYAARFLGPRGYLVTFVKVDPLITLDLTDPAAPRVVGELKVPGYSEYLHPLGENHLLAVGKGATVQDGTAWYQGVQLSVFDVTAFDAPQLLYRQELGDRGSDSEALRTHKAFTYWDGEGETPGGLLALPVRLLEHAAPPRDPWEYGEPVFTGVEVFRVGIEGGFTELGRIATADPAGGWAGWGWSRGVFIGERVYAVTADAVRSAPVGDLRAPPQRLDLAAGE